MLEFTKNWNASSLGSAKEFQRHYLVLKIQRCTTESLSVTESLYLPTSFTPSPRLAHIELPEWPLPQTFPHFPTLKSLTIDGMFLDMVTIHEIIPLLDSTPSLRHFVLKGSKFFWVHTAPPQTTTHALSTYPISSLSTLKYWGLEHIYCLP